MKVCFFDKDTGEYAGCESISKIYIDECMDYFSAVWANWNWKAQVLNPDGSVYRLVNY